MDQNLKRVSVILNSGVSALQGVIMYWSLHSWHSDCPLYRRCLPLRDVRYAGFHCTTVAIIYCLYRTRALLGVCAYISTGREYALISKLRLIRSSAWTRVRATCTRIAHALCRPRLTLLQYRGWPDKRSTWRSAGSISGGRRLDAFPSKIEKSMELLVMGRVYFLLIQLNCMQRACLRARAVMMGRAKGLCAYKRYALNNEC